MTPGLVYPDQQEGQFADAFTPCKHKRRCPHHHHYPEDPGVDHFSKYSASDYSSSRGR